jgi:hypothetical protein
MPEFTAAQHSGKQDDETATRTTISAHINSPERRLAESVSQFVRPRQLGLSVSQETMGDIRQISTDSRRRSACRGDQVRSPTVYRV